MISKADSLNSYNASSGAFSSFAAGLVDFGAFLVSFACSYFLGEDAYSSFFVGSCAGFFSDFGFSAVFSSLISAFYSTYF